jgi:hypothetical protein
MTEPAAAELTPQPLNPLFVEREPRKRDRLPGSFGMTDGRVEMIGHSLEFGVEHTHQTRLDRDLDPRQVLDRPAEGDAMGHRGHTLTLLGEKDPVMEIHPLEAAFDTSVLVEDAGAQMRYVFARGLHEVLD